MEGIEELEDYNCYICGKTTLDGTETIVEGDTAYMYHKDCWELHKKDECSDM